MKYLARTSFKMRLILIWQLCLSRAREWEREERRGWGLSGLVAWEQRDNTHSTAHKHQYMATECKGSLMDAICFQLKPPFKPPYLTSKIQRAPSFGRSWVKAVFICASSKHKCRVYSVHVRKSQTEMYFHFMLKARIIRYNMAHKMKKEMYILNYKLQWTWSHLAGAPST